MKSIKSLAIPHDEGKQTQSPQHLNALGISMFGSAGFFDKNLYCSQIKSERTLPCWTLFNGYFTSLSLIEDIGKVLTRYWNTFPKDAKNAILFYFGYFGVAEGRAQNNKNHMSIHKSPKPLRHQERGRGQIWPTTVAAPAAIPAGRDPAHLHVIWSLTKDLWWWVNMKFRHPLCYSPVQQFYPTGYPIVLWLYNVPRSLELGAQTKRGRTEGGNVGAPGQELSSS